MGLHFKINELSTIINFKTNSMKSRFHKKLSLKKVTIFKYKIFGGSATPSNESIPTQSSAFHEPTEFSLFDTNNTDDPTTISGNQQTCM